MEYVKSDKCTECAGQSEEYCEECERIYVAEVHADILEDIWKE